ncbi:hypothetical protein ACFLS7_03045 [Bacteroidota bacterium]
MSKNQVLDQSRRERQRKRDGERVGNHLPGRDFQGRIGQASKTNWPTRIRNRENVAEKRHN